MSEVQNTTPTAASRNESGSTRQENPPVAGAPSPPPRARAKRKLDAQKQTEICAMISVGCSVRTTAKMVGCSSQAIHKLANKDPAFEQRIRRAYMMSEFTPLNTIFVASRTHWRAAAWLLERLNRQEFGRRSPEMVTPQELKQVIFRFGDELMSVIPDPETRQRVYEHVEKAFQGREHEDPSVARVRCHGV